MFLSLLHFIKIAAPNVKTIVNTRMARQTIAFTATGKPSLFSTQQKEEITRFGLKNQELNLNRSNRIIY